MSVDEPISLIMRWRLWLSPSDFSMIYLPGRKPQVRDDVSRLGRDTEPNLPFDDDEIPNFEGTAAYKSYEISL